MFGEKTVEIKAAEPCAIGFWKKKCNFNPEKNKWLLSYKRTQEIRLRVLQ